MYLVTGGAGFIGSNIVRKLSQTGEFCYVIDDLDDDKFKNLIGCDIEFVHRNHFYDILVNISNPLEVFPWMKSLKAIIHQGAVSSTTATNSEEVIQSNLVISRVFYFLAKELGIPFIYASSASVYGMSEVFKERPEFESPANLYGFSKLLFDNFLRRESRLRPGVVGLRYFNVYGPGEAHKRNQTSPVYRFWEEIKSGGNPQVFEGDDGNNNDARDHSRDFVHVSDVVDVILWFLAHPNKFGIFNVGTGESTSFEEVCKLTLKAMESTKGIEYARLPQKLKGKCQPYTKADISNLREAGYEQPFTSIEDGVSRYVKWLNES